MSSPFLRPIQQETQRDPSCRGILSNRPGSSINDEQLRLPTEIDLTYQQDEESHNADGFNIIRPYYSLPYHGAVNRRRLPEKECNEHEYCICWGEPRRDGLTFSLTRVRKVARTSLLGMGTVI